MDIAKESSDIILLENSLLILEQGVLEGRRVFRNIVKYVEMAASSNFGNMFSVVVVILTSLIIVAVGTWLTVSPLATTLGFVPLPPRYWLFLASMLLGCEMLTQVVKTWNIRGLGE